MRFRRLSPRELLPRLGLLFVGILGPIAAVELLVHAVEARRGPIFPGGMRTLSFSEPDAELEWRHVVNFSQRYGWPEHPDGFVVIATNNLGLREDLPTANSPNPGTRRILVLGDSHTDGLVNNSESWPNVLERGLEATGERWEVLNAGVTGYQPPQYRAWWRRYGVQLKPDLVVLGYYLGNDFMTDPIPDDGTAPTPVEDAPEASSEPGGPARVLRGLRHRCRLCALTSMVLHRSVLEGPTYEESRFVQGNDEDEKRMYLAATRQCLGCVWQSVEQHWRVEREPGVYSRRIESTRRYFELFNREVERAGAELVVVLIPSKLQVEPASASLADTTAATLGVPIGSTPLEDRLEGDLRALLSEIGIRRIDVRAALEREFQRLGTPVYYDGDWHLNVRGLSVVGETVTGALSGSSRR